MSPRGGDHHYRFSSTTDGSEPVAAIAQPTQRRPFLDQALLTDRPSEHLAVDDREVLANEQ